MWKIRCERKRLIPYCQAICKNNFSAAIGHPPVFPPLRLFPPPDIPEVQFSENSRCENGDCFDFSCPITGGFPIFIYDLPQEFQNDAALFLLNTSLKSNRSFKIPHKVLTLRLSRFEILKDTIFLFQNWPKLLVILIYCT